MGITGALKTVDVLLAGGFPTKLNCQMLREVPSKYTPCSLKKLLLLIIVSTHGSLMDWGGHEVEVVAALSERRAAFSIFFFAACGPPGATRENLTCFPVRKLFGSASFLVVI
jgi:hypothetical protein